MKPLAPLALLLACAAPAQAAGDVDLARCRAIAADAARLACYDALAGAAPVPAAAPPPAAAPAPLAAPAAVAAAPEFGFESRVPASAPEAVESRIAGRFDGWEPGMKIRLENGQVWQVSDGSRGVVALRDPKVRVTRAAMGTFFLEFEGKRQAPRVRRVE
jgi:hypothetical protein